jgi:hypothetical protein
MSEVPALICPRCRGALEYQVTVEMLKPAIGKIDTGYCRACRRLFECVRQTNTFYDSTLWPPLCRVCRQPVAFASVSTDDAGRETLRYVCRDHPGEQWTLVCSDDHWFRHEQPDQTRS